MTCRSCAEARKAAATGAKAIIRGDIRTAGAQVKEMAGHIADKARAESERVRKMVQRERIS